MTRYALDFQWRGFELHPEIPLGGLDLVQMFPRPQVDAMVSRLRQVADGMGIPFAAPPHAPNTKAALAISEHARQQGKLDGWREHAMNAYWRDTRDLEDRGVLRELAAAADLDPDAALGFLDDPSVPALLRSQRDEAQRWGVTGIPTWFMLPDGWKPGDPRPANGTQPVRVVGCQPMEVVERAAQMAGATPITA